MDNTKSCWASVNVYDREETVPKRLAKEDENILHDGMILTEKSRQFCLTPGKDLYGKVLWYRQGEEWLRAEQTGKMWMIPGDAMRSHTICRMAFCSAKIPIAFTCAEAAPDDAQERILVFHFMKERKERPDAED